MNILISRVLILALALSTTTGLATTALSAPKSFADQGPASMTMVPQYESDGKTISGYIIRKVMTEYHEVNYPTWNVLKAIVTTNRMTNAEGGDGQVQLQMFANDRGTLDKVLWTTQLPGEKVQLLNDEFVGVMTYGCCGAEDTTRLLDINTGRKVQAALGTVFQIGTPNSQLPSRYLSQAIDSKAPEKLGPKSYIGTVDYYSREKIVARARMYVELPQNFVTSLSEFRIVGLRPNSKLQIRNAIVDLWDNDGQKTPQAAFTDFALEANVYLDSATPERVRIVINGDTIDEKASGGSSKVAIQFVK